MSDSGQFIEITAPDPVSEGDRVTVTIEDVGKQGDGVAKVEGLVIFVPDTQEGDEVEIEITGVGERVAWGEVVE